MDARQTLIDIERESRMQAKIQQIYALSEQASGIEILGRILGTLIEDPQEQNVELDIAHIAGEGEFETAFTAIRQLFRARTDREYITHVRVLVGNEDKIPGDAHPIPPIAGGDIPKNRPSTLPTFDVRVAAGGSGIDYFAIGPTRLRHSFDRVRLTSDRREGFGPLEAVGRITHGFPLAEQQDQAFEARWGLARLISPIADSQISSSIFYQVSSIYEFVW